MVILLAWISFSQSLGSTLAGADPDGLLDGQNEDLPVTDSPRPAHFLDDAAGAGGVFLVDEKLDLDLRQEVDDVLGATIQLRVPLWRPNPFTSDTVIPWMPSRVSASLISSSLNGFTIASIFFI